MHRNMLKIPSFLIVQDKQLMYHHLKVSIFLSYQIQLRIFKFGINIFHLQIELKQLSRMTLKLTFSFYISVNL